MTQQVSHHQGRKTCVEMEGKTIFSRATWKQFDVLTWLTLNPIFCDRSTPLQRRQWLRHHHVNTGSKFCHNQWWNGSVRQGIR